LLGAGFFADHFLWDIARDADDASGTNVVVGHRVFQEPMTEGPSARLIADRVRSVLEGKRLERVEWPNSLVMGDILQGRRVLRVDTHGKNILLHLSGQQSFRVHLLMGGKIRIAKEAEPLAAPIRLGFWARGVRVAVVGAPKIELLSTTELDTKLSTLGPDPLRPDFDLGRVRRNLQGAGDATLAECLLDQGIVAGVGNIWKSEILFEARLDPKRPASSLGLAERSRLAQTVATVLQRAYDTNRRGQRNKLSMYRRAGRPCPRCDTAIDGYRLVGRMTYSCPRCQR
jgi:endonuclease VIII